MGRLYDYRRAPVLLVGLVFSIACVRGQTVQLNVKDLADQGLHLIPSTDPSFPGLVNTIMGGQTNPAIQMETPFSAVLRNDSGKVLLAYSLRWLCVSNSGKTTRRDVFYQTLSGNSEWRIGPGQAALVSPSHSYLKYFDTSVHASGMSPRYAELLQQASITLSLDAVIFGDGTFAGPDETHAFAQAMGLMQSRPGVMRDVLNRHRVGEPDGSIFRSLEGLANAPDGPGGVASLNWDLFYRKQAAQILLNRFRRSGAQAAYDTAAFELTQPVTTIRRIGQ